MSGSPSRYGGIAAVLIFGIGLLAVGKIWAGIGVLVLGTLAIAIALSPSVAGRVFFVAVGALILSGVLGFRAAANEFTGSATYHVFRYRHSRSEQVTRESSPVKFRAATNFLWGGSVLCAFVGTAAFVLSRKLDTYENDF